MSILSFAIAPMIYNQSEFNLRCEWGPQGVAQLAPISDVVVIVDVLSFSTCVESLERYLGKTRSPLV
ncbi:MAG: hypothetical protein ACYT04_70510 [Nostoc sp.]